MEPRKILCPIDFSSCSELALQHASERAASSGAKLYIVHVEGPGRSSLPGTPGYVAELDGHRRLLDEAKPRVEGVDFEQHCLRGSVIDEIQRFARLRDIDLIVMGTHGRTGLARVFMGSVAKSLSEDAPCEVLAVPLPRAVRTTAAE